MTVQSYLLDNEMLLFSETQQCLFRLNPSASFLWCCHEDGLSEAEIIEEMVEAFQISHEQAESDWAATLAEWHRLGIVGPDTGVPVEDDTDGVLEALDNGGATPPALDVVSASEQAVAYYRVLERIVEVRYADMNLLESAGLAIAPLMVETEGSPEHRFLVAPAGHGFAIQYGDRIVEFCDTLEELPPLVLAQLMARVYLDTPCLLGIHAAVLCRSGGCVVMPAVSGSGKSTLAAALAARDYDYCTDELVVVLKGSQTLLTAPVGMGIKSGSWDVLKRFYPGLDDLPVCPRPDGKQVRYLSAPSPVNSPLDGRGQLRALVFPQYRPEKDTALERLSTAEAICRLTDAGYDVAGGLNKETVGELIGWVQQLPCYQLLFDDLDDAVEMMNGLMS